MHIGLVTLFPEMFVALTGYGITGRACDRGLMRLQYWNPRDFSTDKHRSVDDKPFGGGPGMLMKTGPLQAAIGAAREGLRSQALSENGQDEHDSPKVAFLSPQGKRLDQQAVEMLAARTSMVLVCGRYQGIDARVIDSDIDEEWSLGDFVLSGGELAAMALIDALIRYQPGALGGEDSVAQDSFANGLLHSPQYTRPQTVAGKGVPDVLLSGDHEAIRVWRLKHSLGNTWLKRPALLQDKELSTEQRQLLNEYIAEYQIQEQAR